MDVMILIYYENRIAEHRKAVVRKPIQFYTVIRVIHRCP